MNENEDFFDQLDAERSAIDPEYAAMRRRQKMVIRLIGLRKELKLTQADVAVKMGVKRAQVAALESRPSSVSMDMIFRYADALGAQITVTPPIGHGEPVLV